MKKLISHSCSILILLVFLGAGPVFASEEKVAVLPFADLSNDFNGIEMEIAAETEKALQRQGFEVVTEEQVGAFMRDYQIRRAGVLDSFLARKIGEDLGCQYVFVGTVTENGAGTDPTYAFTITAIDTRDGIPVWSSTRATSFAENVKLLGLGEPETIAELHPQLLDSAFKRIREEMTRRRELEAQPPFQVIDVKVAPQYVRGEADVDCRLKARFIGPPPKRVLLEGPEGRSELVSEPGSGLYRGKLLSPPDEGQYPVSLLLEWDDRIERIEGIDGFEVINNPPEFHLKVHQGHEIAGVQTFRSHLVFSPELKKPTPLGRWVLEIRSMKGVIMAREEYLGPPPEKMVWKGVGAGHKRLPDGQYEFCVRVWDLAGNKGEDSRRVALKTAGTSVALSSVIQNELTYMQIQPAQEKSVPVASWTLRLRSETGDLIAKRAGKELPAFLEIPGGKKGGNIKYEFEARDVLGNRIQVEGQTIEALQAEEKPESETPAFVSLEKKSSSWEKEF